MSKEQSLFRVRDKRKKGWFFMDNEYLNGYARIFGAVGTAIYVSLCRHADNETQKCFPSIKLISEELNISKPTVIKYLKAFEEFNLIEKTTGKRNKKQQWINNEYLLLDKSEWKKATQVKSFNTGTQVKSFNDPSKTVLPTQVKSFNSKDTQPKDTQLKETHHAKQGFARKLSSEEKEHKKQIDELIDMFKEVNPTHERLFGNKTERASLERLVKKFGKDWVEKLLKVLPRIVKQPYAPRITTPYQLEKKMGELKTFIEQQRSIKNSKGKRIIYASLYKKDEI